MQHARAPGSVVFTDEELDRMKRAQAALLLHKFPSEVDDQPERDIADVLAMDTANKKIEAERMSKRHRRRT